MKRLALATALLLTGCPSFHTGPMPGEPPKAAYLNVEGARVRWVERGSGPAVVLLHGFASSLETWNDVMPELAKRHRVIALDLKGFGWTDRPPGDYSPEAQARLVYALLDRRGIDRTAVVAHSWGSSVALAMALLQPARVTRLGLYDAWVYEEQLPTFFHWARAGGLGEALVSIWYDERPDERMALGFYDPRFVTEGLVEDVERSLERPGTKAAALAAMRGQRFAAMQARYRTVDKPALLLWGREDRVTRLAFGERLARELPRAKLVVYPRCGHFPMIEARAASNADLAAFLAEEAAAGPPAPRSMPERRDPPIEPDPEPPAAPPAASPEDRP